MGTEQIIQPNVIFRPFDQVPGGFCWPCNMNLAFQEAASHLGCLFFPQVSPRVAFEAVFHSLASSHDPLG